MASIHSLVIGASGQVGQHLLAQLRDRKIPVQGTYSQHIQDDLLKLDIADTHMVSAFLEAVRPQVIYLPASLTNVDYCEQHPDESHRINVIGTSNIVRSARTLSAKVVYFSSDYIFNGKQGPYKEEDSADPVCVYGLHKVYAEHMVSLHAVNFLIIRTTVVYGWENQGKNFVNRLLRALRSGHEMRVPADQIGSPTYAPDLAACVIDLVDREMRGVVNVVGRKRVSRYDFALAVARTFGLDGSQIIPVETTSLGQSARRPLNAGMTVNKVEAILQRHTLDYEQGLEMMMKAERRS